MKILTGAQIKHADRYTIENEPVDSINLMERAAETIAQWICNNVPQECPMLFFAGKGNNGGDGLAVARMLFHAGFDCRVILPFAQEDLSPDCAFNLRRLPDGVPVLRDTEGVEAEPDTVVVDALLGTGLKDMPLQAGMDKIVDYINSLECRVISIDMPSGMLTEFGNAGRRIVHASTTLALEYPKLAQLLPEAGDFAGELVVLPIGLSTAFFDKAQSDYYYITREMVQSLLETRVKFAHKGSYGHALLVCGSEGMMGAAILATGAALRSGCGMVTAHVPREERLAITAAYPSALLSLDSGDSFTSLIPASDRYDAIGVGCGLGRGEMTVFALSELMQQARGPMIIDADALNIIAVHRDMIEYIPPYSILTPHLGELRRLVGEWGSEEEKINMVRDFAANHEVIMVVKGAHTMVCLPDGECLFNSAGTPAMAKGGSGDVLTGFLTGLLARGYDPFDAAVLGVYAHGLAGEKGADFYGAESLMSSDLVDLLAEAMQDLAGKSE